MENLQPYCVADRPETTIESSNPDQFFLLDAVHSLRCNVDSVPLPDHITWHWQMCDIGVCEPSEDRWVDINQLATNGSNPLLINMNVGTEGSGRLDVTGNKSGIFRCTGTNSLGQGTAQMKYIASGKCCRVCVSTLLRSRSTP